MAQGPWSADPEKLKEAFKRAADIAEVVPPGMQEAAFHRALDQILGSEPAQPASKPRGSRRPPKDGGADPSGGDPVSRLLEGINRTAYPDVSQTTNVLDRALWVLRIAANDFDIDGLTAPEVARVLTDKFRRRTSRQAVAYALGTAHTMVDTGKRGKVTVYRIMQEGDTYLEAGGAHAGHRETGGAKPARRRRKGARKRISKAGAETPTGHKRTSRPSQRRGPKTALAELVDEGFFGAPRTINDAQEQLRHKKGVRFSLQELSPALVRLLRDGRLDRDRNESGQYEYEAK
jgi:hypothetical protein